MSERLSDVEARIGTVDKLSAVISAMRGIAASRAQEAQKHLASIEAFAATIGAAISQALAFLPDADRQTPGQAGSGRRAIIVLTAEQGFAGPYSEAVFDAAAPLLEMPRDLFIVGDRGLGAARERGLAAVWSAPMIAHPAQAAALASRLTLAIYQHLAEAGLREVYIVHQAPAHGGVSEIVTKRLVPFDQSRFKRPAPGVPPRITLDPQTLLARLIEEYVFAELSEAVMLAFAAENAARTRAMMAAHDNLTNTLTDLQASSRRLRQAEITEEIMELATGALPQR